MIYYRMAVQREGQWEFATGFHTQIQSIVMWYRMNQYNISGGKVIASHNIRKFDTYLGLLNEGKPTVAMDIRHVLMGYNFDVALAEARLERVLEQVTVENSWVVQDAENYLERLVNPRAAMEKDKAARRLLFAKWLVESGRIGEGLDMVKGLTW